MKRAATVTAMALLALLGVAKAARADGIVVSQQQCGITWQAGMQNEDGSTVTDLKEFRIYMATSESEALLPTTTPWAVIQSGTPAPDPNFIYNISCTSLAARQWYFTISQVDLSGNEGARITPIPFVLQDTVRPGPVRFPRIGPSIN